MADLSVVLCGIKLRNPLVLASGPLSWSAAGIRAAFEAGAAAVVTKTIRVTAATNPRPHIAAAGHRSMLNTEAWSDLPAQQWIEQEIPSLSDRKGVLIASTGHTPEEVKHLARPLARIGADMLELVSYRAQDAAPMVAVAKRTVSIPVLVKVSANWPDLVGIVKACLQAGADGITAIDSLGPALRVDVETRKPVLGSFAWLSGEAILPAALASVASIRLEHGDSCSVVGTGGVTGARDVLEMLMVGATAVGVHSAPLLQGLGWFDKTLTQLTAWLDARTHTDLSSLRGTALQSLKEPFVSPVVTFSFDANACTLCGRCETVCAYGARRVLPGPEMRLDTVLCRSCSLCTSVCPTGALRA
jgi:dihydroorotate dehydrogenase (fumarate)